MLIKTKDPSGAPVVINTDHILFFGQAVDGASKGPLLGHSIVFFVGGQQAVVRASPEDLWKLTCNTQTLIAAAGD